MDRRLAIFRELLGAMPPGHLLDVATGHGRFAVVARDLGWKVTAFDARTERWPDATGIDWVQSDVRDFDFDAERYTCINVPGLFYHLEIDDQLDLLRRCSGVTTILETHVSLSPDREEQGYQGHLFDEGEIGPTSSWGNQYSFWPTEESLIRMLHDAGFTSVYSRVPHFRAGRNFYLALSEQEPRARASLIDNYRQEELVPGARTLDPLERVEQLELALRNAQEQVSTYRRNYEELRSHPVVRGLRTLRGTGERLRRRVRDATGRDAG
jgi:hypothetical protein